MKRFFANSLMICVTAIALVATSCNDEVRDDHDRDRTEENTQNIPGPTKPSEYSKAYDTVAVDNKTITPDSNRVETATP